MRKLSRRKTSMALWLAPKSFQKRLKIFGRNTFRWLDPFPTGKRCECADGRMLLLVATTERPMLSSHRVSRGNAMECSELTAVYMTTGGEYREPIFKAKLIRQWAWVRANGVLGSFISGESITSKRVSLYLISLSWHVTFEPRNTSLCTGFPL